MTSPYRENEHGLENAVEEAGQKLLDAAALAKEQRANQEKHHVALLPPPLYIAPTRKRVLALQVAGIVGFAAMVSAGVGYFSSRRSSSSAAPVCMQKDIEVFKTWMIGEPPSFKAQVSTGAGWHQYVVMYSPQYEGWAMYIDGKPARVFIPAVGTILPGPNGGHMWTNGKDPAYWGTVKP